MSPLKTIRISSDSYNQAVPISLTEESRFILLVSGLQIGSLNYKSSIQVEGEIAVAGKSGPTVMAPRLLAAFLAGRVGQREVARRIVRMIIAGDSLSNFESGMHKEKDR